MSTKTIAVEASVYARLARHRLESESFTKAIVRLLDVAGEARTGGRIADALSEMTPLTAQDAERMANVSQDARLNEKGARHDLR